MDQDWPAIDIVSVNYNGLLFLEDYFTGLEQLNYPKDKLRLFLIDNNSRDGSRDYLKKLKPSFSLIVVKNKKNYGFAQAANAVFSSCKAEYIALLNCDTRPDRDWLSWLVRTMQKSPGAGICCSRRIPVQTYGYTDPATNETSWCSGGQSLIRKAAFEKVGYFEEKFFMYAEDLDLSWRMWLAGFSCLYVPESICEHHFGKKEGYTTRRLYYRVRNAILLGYVYGTGREIRRALLRWVWEGFSLGLKRFRLNEAWAVFAGLAAHFIYIPYFLKKRKQIAAHPDFKKIKEQWIKI
jgi:GT2 family glycosyltransferase